MISFFVLLFLLIFPISTSYSLGKVENKTNNNALSEEEKLIIETKKELDYFFTNRFFKIVIEEELTKEGQIAFKFSSDSYFKSNYAPVTPNDSYKIKIYHNAFKSYLKELIDIKYPQELPERKASLYQLLSQLKGNETNINFKKKIDETSFILDQKFSLNYQFYLLFDPFLKEINTLDNLQESFNKIYNDFNVVCHFNSNNKINCEIDFKAATEDSILKKGLSYSLFNKNLDKLMKNIIFFEENPAILNKDSLLSKLISHLDIYAEFLTIPEKETYSSFLNTIENKFTISMGIEDVIAEKLRKGTLNQEILFKNYPDNDPDRKKLHYILKIDYQETLSNIPLLKIKDFVYHSIDKNYSIFKDNPSVKLNIQLSSIIINANTSDFEDTFQFKNEDNNMIDNNFILPSLSREKYDSNTIEITKQNENKIVIKVTHYL